MSDVKLYVPQDMLAGGPFISNFVDTVAFAVARHMDGNDYDGNPLNMTPGDVDVMPFPYPHQGKTNAVILIEVAGYDYPDRMASIGQRLEAIVQDLIEFVSTPPVGKKKISITFIDLQDRCWYGSPE